MPHTLQILRYALPIIAALHTLTLTCHAQLRIVNYNTENKPNNAAEQGYMQTILGAINGQSVQGIAKSIDIMVVQETDSASLTALVGMLNTTAAGGSPYQSVASGSFSGDVFSFIYDTRTVQYLNSVEVTIGPTRPAFRVQFRPVGYSSSDAAFYLYDVHLKASDTSADRSQRNAEATNLRANADAVGANRHILYAGDFNFYSASEAGYQTMRAAGNAQAIDPLNGLWSGSAITQDPTATFDDRFDLQLGTAAMHDGEGLSMISGSYRAFGNVNGVVTTGNGVSATTVTALQNGPDHLPVVVDYQLPAKLAMSIETTPPTVIQGAAVSTTVAVWNSANVIAANGADELDYTITGSGVVVGQVAGVDAALGGVPTHSLALNTATPGRHTGMITGATTSQGATNTSTPYAVALDVLAHATASFDGASIVSDITLDLGSVHISDSASHALSLHNLTTVAGFTAGLDLDAIIAAGDTDVLHTNLATFENLDAGSSLTFGVSFDPVTVGIFEATYTLYWSDQDLPAATTGTPLTLHLHGIALAPEPAALLLLLFGCVCMGHRRPHRAHQSQAL